MVTKKKKLSTITADIATIAVIAGIGAVGLPSQQQIAFAQGVEDSGEGGEEVSFDDVKVVDGEEVIEVGTEEGEEERREDPSPIKLDALFEELDDEDLRDFASRVIVDQEAPFGIAGAFAQSPQIIDFAEDEGVDQEEEGETVRDFVIGELEERQQDIDDDDEQIVRHEDIAVQLIEESDNVGLSQITGHGDIP
jgi:hypothetical protein